MRQFEVVTGDDQTVKMEFDPPIPAEKGDEMMKAIQQALNNSTPGTVAVDMVIQEKPKAPKPKAAPKPAPKPAPVDEKPSLPPRAVEAEPEPVEQNLAEWLGWDKGTRQARLEEMKRAELTGFLAQLTGDALEAVAGATEKARLSTLREQIQEELENFTKGGVRTLPEDTGDVDDIPEVTNEEIVTSAHAPGPPDDDDPDDVSYEEVGTSAHALGPHDDDDPDDPDSAAPAPKAEEGPLEWPPEVCNATSLRDIVAWLVETGVEGEAAVTAEVERMKDSGKVPAATKANYIGRRVKGILNRIS